MLYVLYSFVGNSQGIEEYLAYSEIDEEGYWLRHLEIRADGRALRYTAELPADIYGQLPEGCWEPGESTRREYGTVAPITKALFYAVWSLTKCENANCE